MKSKSYRYFMAFLLSLVMLNPTFAVADPLDDAKAAGYILEKPDGYVMAAETAPASLDKLVEDINNRRLKAYERIAKKNGISVEVVASESYRIRHKKNN